MNKCEHGQKITLFCATDCCVWKEAAGCEACMKKYHNHMGTKVFLGEEEVISIVKKYTMDSSIKPKCRLLQEAIYSYFNLLKAELTASLDAACKNIINQIGYPYLYANNTLSTYKRLKNKEYKKLMQKDFKCLYELTQKITDRELVNEEAKIYINQMKMTEELVKGLENMIKDYQGLIKKYHSTFAHEAQHYEKITEIFKNLNSESPRANQNKLKQDKKAASPVYQFKNQFQDKQDKQDKTFKPQEFISPQPMGRIPAIGAPPSLMRPNYSRDVSIDGRLVKQHKFAGGSKMEKQKSEKQLLPGPKGLIPREKSERIESVRQQINTKQIQINEKKKVLIEMMKQKEESIKNVKARIEANSFEMKNKYLNEKKQEQQLQLKTQQISEPSINKGQQIKITVYETKGLTHESKKFSEGSKSTNRMSFPLSIIDNKQVTLKSSGDVKEKSSMSQSQSNSQSELDLQGFKPSNDIQNYAFTTLPIEESLPKKNVQQVQRKLMVITTDRFDEKQPLGATSPILILKGVMDRKEAHRMQDSMVEKKLFTDTVTPSTPQKPEPIKKKEPQEHQMLLELIPIYHKKSETILQLKQNQQKSLALLLKCLPLKGEEAVIYLQRAIQIAENNLSAAEYLSYLYLDLDRPLDCLKLCNKMIQRIENSNEQEELLLMINNNKAAALNVLGRYSESIVLLERCIRCRQKDYFYKNLGDAYFSISIYEKAIYNYEKCLRLNDQYDESHYNLAVCLYVQQNYHNAKLSIQKAIQINSLNESYHELLHNIDTRINHY